MTKPGEGLIDSFLDDAATALEQRWLAWLDEYYQASIFATLPKDIERMEREVKQLVVDMLIKVNPLEDILSRQDTFVKANFERHS